MDDSFEIVMKFKRFYAKYVKVKAFNGQVYEGWFKSIDPVTGTLNLVTVNSDNSEIQNSVFVIGGQYCEVEIIREDKSMEKIIPNLFSSPYQVLNESLKSRKERLKLWLEIHGIPVRRVDDSCSLIVCESVYVKPPYGVENCSSMNIIMLERTCNLLLTLPEDKTIEQLSEFQLDCS